MPDVVTLARTARESLARGLNALQADPAVPPHLQELAAPIAQAMGALHQIERSGGAQLVPQAQNALASVQGALAQLQAQPVQHPAVMTAMEAVAGALSGVHALSRAAAQPAPARPAYPQAQYAPPPAQPSPPYGPPPVAQPAAASPYGPPPVAQPPAPQAYAPPPAAQPPAAQGYAQQQRFPQAAPASGGNVSPYAPTAMGAPIVAPPQAAAPFDAQAIAAELGAHSPSNFYKGLSGNDIVDHGGLFVSTYKLPKLGSRVRLRVSLPGGYEFEANAVVRWRREASDASDAAPPGFGAQFTDITPEARQLVYRYVRNREPMFHDDL